MKGERTGMTREGVVGIRKCERRGRKECVKI